MHLDIWAATTGVEAGRNPSGGPHQTSPEQSARLIVRAMRRSERERAFGTGDVDEAAQALAHERRRTGLSREQRRHEFEEAHAAGIGTGAVAGAAQVVGRLALAVMYVCLFGALGGILVVVGLDAITGTDLMDAAVRSVPGLPQQLPLMVVVYPFVCAALHDAAQTVRRYALRRRYFAWACGREGQIARGTSALPAPELRGAAMAALPARVLAPTSVVLGLAIGGVIALQGHVGDGLITFLAFSAGALILSVVAGLQRWRLRRIMLLHDALAGRAIRA